MLTENNKLENQDDRIACVIRGWCAYDPITKANLRRSNGRHKYGQRSKYYLSWEGHDLKVFRAFTDAEAIEKAVKHMNMQLQNEWEEDVEARVDAMSY